MLVHCPEKKFSQISYEEQKKSLSKAHELWHHAVVQLSGLFYSHIITHFMRERLYQPMYAAFRRVPCHWYQGMERKGERARSRLSTGRHPGGTRAGRSVLWPSFSHIWTVGSASVWVKKAKCCCPLALPQRVQLLSRATAHSCNNRSSQPCAC